MHEQNMATWIGDAIFLLLVNGVLALILKLFRKTDLRPRLTRFTLFFVVGTLPSFPFSRGLVPHEHDRTFLFFLGLALGLYHAFREPTPKTPG